MVRAAIYKAPIGSVFHAGTATYIYLYIYMTRQRKPQLQEKLKSHTDISSFSRRHK